MRLFSELKADLARIDKPSLRNAMRWYCLPQGECYPYVVWMRLLQATRRHTFMKLLFGVPIYILYRHFEIKYGIHANVNISIGPGFRPVHGPCNLNAASIGANFTVYSGATIGTHKGGIPTIGDNVSIFPNAVVCGPITIGNNAIIGALSYISHDINEGGKHHTRISIIPLERES